MERRRWGPETALSGLSPNENRGTYRLPMADPPAENFHRDYPNADLQVVMFLDNFRTLARPCGRLHDPPIAECTELRLT
jgi:hypothetical protein